MAIGGRFWIRKSAERKKWGTGGKFDAQKRFARLRLGEGREEFGHAHQVEDALEVVSQGDQVPLGSYFLQSFEQKVIVTQAAFDRAKGVFHQSLALFAFFR